MTAANPKTESIPDVDFELSFRLIDSILPFEVCLYHQILPMGLEGSRLRLGMVSPDDSSALDYVRRILSYMNCSLKPQRIPSELHHSVLTAYLNYSNQSSPADSSDEPSPVESRHSGSARSDGRRSPSAHRSPKGAAKPMPTYTGLNDGLNDTDAPTIPALHVETHHLSDSFDELADLPPAQLLQELLGRILIGGIGRLYFEQKSDYGRILWSQNGHLQAVLEEVPIATLREVIQELKALAVLPPTPVQKLKHVELERFYEGSVLLLRMRITPGQYGEEATLQALRGVALKFHQRQQLNILSQEAITIAQDLQQKVNEIRLRTRLYPMQTPEQASLLPAFEDVLKSIAQQVEALKSIPIDHTIQEDL